MEEGSFRADLLYRLQVITLVLPPLRERREDVPALAVHFLGELSRRHGREVRELDEGARRVLVAHDWPGNVRELRNAMERAVVMAEGERIGVADLPASLAAATAPIRPAEAALAGLPYAEARERALESFDRAFLSAVLERNGGNVSAAARDLGLHRQSLQRRLRNLGT